MTDDSKKRPPMSAARKDARVQMAFLKSWERILLLIEQNPQHAQKWWDTIQTDLLDPRWDHTDDQPEDEGDR